MAFLNTKTQRHKEDKKNSLLFFAPSCLRGFLLCLFFPLLLAGCSRGGQTELNIDLSVILPAEWVAVENWTTISIDADSENEYLLFYTYDASETADGNPTRGPIGAVIYDSQTPASVPPSAADAGPPAPWLQPYALMPSYWRGAGDGFVAPPLAERPNAFPVKRVLPEEIVNTYSEIGASPQNSEAIATPTAPSDNDELVVFGGSSVIGGVTHISVFWWINSQEGYGSTQIAAPGGLKVTKWDGGEERSPIREVRAYYPEDNRSQLCREIIWSRYLDPEYTSTRSFRPAVHYYPRPHRLIFCYGIPATPFYPEGVVLAWLLDPNGQAALVVDAARHTDLTLALGAYQSVSAIQYHQTVDANGPVRAAGTPPLQTKVWASLVYPTEAGDETRRYEFTLEHLPTNNSERTTDQWRIVGAVPVEPKG